MSDHPEIYDYIIVGSGFGGAVSAMRLSEKGYRVLVLEKGKRWQAEDFPKTNWNIRKYLWAPILKCFGIQQISFFNEALVLSGTGVGGGSLVYANTHLEPKKDFYQNPTWSHFQDWESTLRPFYTLAKRMLGTTPYPHHHAEDEYLKQVAKDMLQEKTFRSVNVGVYFGDPAIEIDPYFNGEGPLRKGCTLCAGCMVGCRFHAKNTLDKNYLYFAEKKGAQILPLQKAVRIDYHDSVYTVQCEETGAWLMRNKTSYQARGLIVSAGVLGTLDLLFRQKFQHKTLTLLSDQLGSNLRTNSESLCGVTGASEKLNHGVAITSVFDADEHTHIEICKYPDNSGLMGKLAIFAAGDGPPLMRILKSIVAALRSPFAFIRFVFDPRFAQNSIILLVMQSLDNSMRMVFRKNLFGSWSLQMKNNLAKRVPAFIAKGQEAVNRFAKKTNAHALNSITEITFNLSSTAHILGGCPMGKTKDIGVVDANFAVHGYPQFYILDGSIIPCNLGVNPSLTITALSEFAMSKIPHKK